jgi:hypothetical protein
MLGREKIEERFNKSLHNLHGLLKEINFSADADLWEKVDPNDEVVPVLNFCILLDF